MERKRKRGANPIARMLAKRRKRSDDDMHLCDAVSDFADFLERLNRKCAK